MAQRRMKLAIRRPARTRLRSRTGASEHWLLLLGVVAFAAFAIGAIGSWPFATTRPTIARPMTIAEARSSNAAVPIEARRRLPAARYRFRGGVAERAQAVDCLATAALYEVGNDQRGQKAVIQVILNRVRAVGFPKTICGVVYQGSLRTTGCQFSFTCDRSFDRRRVRIGWMRARDVASRAVSGYVFREVGGATHYHADWIVPYWRGSLVKIARIGPHLFYVRA